MLPGCTQIKDRTLHLQYKICLVTAKLRTTVERPASLLVATVFWIAPVICPGLILYQTQRCTAESKPLTPAMLKTSRRCEFADTQKVFDQSQQRGSAGQSQQIRLLGRMALKSKQGFLKDATIGFAEINCGNRGIF